jgi:hypothetical protein
MLKKLFKDQIGSALTTFDYPILVNSYGRSGSTVLTKSIINSSIEIENKKGRDLAYRSISRVAWDLEKKQLKDGIVYKTHDYPPDSKPKKNVRMLYTFADPVDVVLSLLRLYDERGEEWMKQHYDHLKVPYTNFENIIEEDQLKLEQHMNTWLDEDRFPIAFIKYEAMWEYQDKISEFLGFKIELPTYRKRKAKSKGEDELLSKLENTYSYLRKKIEKINGFFIHNGL